MQTATMKSPAAQRWRHRADGPQAQASRDALAALELKGLPDGGASLRRCTILLFGLGAVGGLMLQQLVRLGVQHIIACDPDTYDSDSFATQPCNMADSGRAKALVQFQHARRINPAVELDFYQCDLQELPLALVRSADLLVGSPDNANAMVHAGRQAASLGKCLIQAAVDPESWSLLVRGYDLRDPQAACPACALGEAEWRRLTSRVGCDPQTARREQGESTRSPAMVTAAAASLGVAEAVKRLTGQHSLALNGEEYLLSLKTNRGWRTRLDRNSRCRCPHQRWNTIEETRHPREVTLCDLARHAGLAEPDDLLQVRGEQPWFSWAGCTECNRRAAVRSFARMGETLRTCECGSDVLAAGSTGWRSVLPAADLRDCWRLPLSELGFAPGQALGFAREEEWTYVFFDTLSTGGE
ncbi:MAG: ThiF family adenylyltransferase [Pirellulales bacterium]